ncbi:hypothetical protein DFR29_11553 [Tahibacter aquaticus]|uniref:GIY-YIG domain-containing protein n=1 Tax=Tahibacter aquaticus TaxID=520092 RepID=A0A4R6YPL3_9GAMM|nr:GIY-YIG nuclease family protein [Tahibacter aquaticus]TDR39665.1 hypothetical protein DFR29_11553 [Tahibacter aquaticus]
MSSTDKLPPRPNTSSAPGTFYVYVHRDRGGTIFYVGKGVGDRAWSRDREALWTHYVNTRSGGIFSAEVVESNLSEAQALLREDELMRTLASQVVNRQNMGRALDLASHQQQADALRQRDRVHAQANTTADPAERAKLLALALTHHEQAASISCETGVVGELLREMGPLGNLDLLDALTKAYGEAGNTEMAASALKHYEQTYRGSAPTKRLEQIRRRVEKMQAGKKTARTIAVATFTPPHSLPPDWERAQEKSRQVVRLDRSLRLSKGTYLDTVEPLKQLRREERFGDALSLMKGAIVDAELDPINASSVPSFYYVEAAKACRNLGDDLQECLVLHRYLQLQAKNRQDPAIVKRLAQAAARLHGRSK